MPTTRADSDGTPSACQRGERARSRVRCVVVGATFVVAAACQRSADRDDAAGVLCGCAGSDTVLESREWTTCVVGKVSEWIDLDSASLQLRNASEKVSVAVFGAASVLLSSMGVALLLLLLLLFAVYCR
jgi:hypothetical protein